MSDRSGRRLPITPARANVFELMRLSRAIPLVTAERPMKLAAVADVRRAAAVKVSWTAIFIKAFSIVAASRPELRTAYMSYPYPHFYEHSQNVGMVIVEREFEGEPFPFNFRFKQPERQSLLELNQSLERARTIPLLEESNFRRLRRIGHLPLPLRRFMWSMGYHLSGRKRAHYFGTFAQSSPAASGAGLATIVSPVTCTLHYGLFDDANQIDMRITFDHRVVDGAPIARALAEMEEVLVKDIVAELKQLPNVSRAA
jgi:hypothetical protein